MIYNPVSILAKVEVVGSNPIARSNFPTFSEAVIYFEIEGAGAV